MSYSITTNVILTFSDQFVSDVMTTAVEEGMDYWADFDVIVRDTNRNVVAFAGEALGDSDMFFDIKGEDIVHAFGLIVSDERYDIELRQAILEQDAGMIDVDYADIIVQVAAFGEIVYG